MGWIAKIKERRRRERKQREAYKRLSEACGRAVASLDELIADLEKQQSVQPRDKGTQGDD